jgi:hypothetical protein
MIEKMTHEFHSMFLLDCPQVLVYVAPYCTTRLPDQTDETQIVSMRTTTPIL